MVKNLLANAEDCALNPGLGRSPGEENSNPLHYSCLGNPMDRAREAWWGIHVCVCVCVYIYIYSPWGHKESDIT